MRQCYHPCFGVLWSVVCAAVCRESFGSVESVKAASDVYFPVAGEVIEANGELEANPSLVNESPIGDGWFVKIRIAKGANYDELMDEAAYKAYLETLE